MRYSCTFRTGSVSFSRMCGGTTLTNWGSPSPKLLPDADSFAIATPVAQFATPSYHRRGFRSLWRIIASGLRANDQLERWENRGRPADRNDFDNTRTIAERIIEARSGPACASANKDLRVPWLHSTGEDLSQKKCFVVVGGRLFEQAQGIKKAECLCRWKPFWEFI